MDTSTGVGRLQNCLMNSNATEMRDALSFLNDIISIARLGFVDFLDDSASFRFRLETVHNTACRLELSLTRLVSLK